MEVDLANFNNQSFKTTIGASSIKQVFWYFTNIFLFRNSLIPFYNLKVMVLRMFGARVGANVIIKPVVSIKYPWKLSIGDNCWIGEKVWIDNLDAIDIGKNVVISQGAMLLSGNHNYKKTSFDLMVNPIKLEDGVWIGARSVVCSGVVCKSHSVLTVNSVAIQDLEPFKIYQGNPAVYVRDRIIE